MEAVWVLTLDKVPEASVTVFDSITAVELSLKVSWSERSEVPELSERSMIEYSVSYQEEIIGSAKLLPVYKYPVHL